VSEIPWPVAAALYNGGIFLLYAWDKVSAQRGWRRVPEQRLLMAAFFFGAPGALAAVYLLRHKTRKPRFSIGLWVTLAGQIGLLALGTWKGWWQQ
jgi:uncharacterized membrane protein YsdA (DUF1294 family)